MIFIELIQLSFFVYNLDLLVLILSVVRLALAVTPEIDIRLQYQILAPDVRIHAASNVHLCKHSVKTVEDLHQTDSKTYVFEISTYIIWYFGFNICVLLAGRILQIVIVTESSFCRNSTYGHQAREKEKRVASTSRHEVATCKRYSRDGRSLRCRTLGFVYGKVRASPHIQFTKKKKKKKRQGAFLLSHLKRRLFSKTLPGVEF